MDIKDMIYKIRGEYVMLDSDLALVYQVETKRINEAVKNNPLKFPNRFSSVLEDDKIIKNLKSKFSTSSSNNNYGGRRYKIRAFT